MRFPTCLTLVLSVTLTSHVAAQSSNANPPRLTADQMRSDVASFRSDFFARDNSYSQSARVEALARLGRLETQLDRISPPAFELAIAQIVALADNGHTIAFPSVRGQHYNRVPIRMTPFESEFRVLRTNDANADLLGATLLAVDGHLVAELRDSARTLTGGTTARRDRGASYLFESPTQLNAMGLSRSADAATYAFQLADGRRVERRLTGETDTGMGRGDSDRWLYAELTPAEQGKWRTVLGVAQSPWTLNEPNVAFRWRAAPEIDAMVIQLRQVFDSRDRTIASFLDEMTQTITKEHPRNLIIDMRLNGGGNLNTARDFMKSLPKLVTGRIFALTSPWTFSAAISSVGYLEQAAPDRVTIVGEEVGDRLVFWAEGRPIALSQSGTMILFATQRHDYKNGCRDFSDCHGPVVQNPIAVPTLVPDLPAPWTFEAYRAGRDPAMEAVATVLRPRS
jgi:hypothetical protein